MTEEQIITLVIQAFMPGATKNDLHSTTYERLVNSAKVAYNAGIDACVTVIKSENEIQTPEVNPNIEPFEQLKIK